MNIYGILIGVFAVVWLFTVFFGYISGVKRGFQGQPAPFTEQSSSLRDQQSEAAEETERKRKDLMESLKQRIRDNQR